MSDYKKYRRTNVAEMRCYIPGEDLSSVSVSKEDAPKAGDMIARNPANHADQWLVDAKYFEDNFEPLSASGDTLAIKDMDPHHIALSQKWIDAQTKISKLESKLADSEHHRAQAKEALEEVQRGKPLGPVVCKHLVQNQQRKILELEAKLAAAEADAGRYLWWVEHGWFYRGKHCLQDTRPLRGEIGVAEGQSKKEAVDDAIDAARGAK